MHVPLHVPLHVPPLVPPLVRRPVDALRHWPVESQLRARRNAMIASTALAQRRAELDEVEEFLGSHHDSRPAAPHAAHG